jgi:PAS domain S-box-containing protein
VTSDATGHRDIEQALRASEARLKLSLELAEQGTWSFSLVDGTGYLDPRAAQIVGLPAGEFRDLIQAQAGRTHPDDLASVRAAVAAGIERGDAFEVAYRVVHADGSVHHVIARAIVICDDDGTPVRLVGTSRDATAAHEATARFEQALVRAEEASRRAVRLQELTAALAGARTVEDVGTIVVARMVAALGARTGAMTMHSRNSEELTVIQSVGFPSDAATRVQRQPIDSRGPVPECFRTATALFVERREEEDGFDARFPSLAPVWDVLDVSSAAYVPLTAGGETVGVISFGYPTAREFSDEERAFLLALGQQAAIAVERARLFAAEQAARREAEAANRAKAEFLAVMSHELRTPLNAIGGYAALIEMGIRGPVSEQQREDLRRVQASQRHLLGLINEVLNYAKLETGSVHYDMEAIRVADAMSSAESLIAPQASAKGLRLEIHECSPTLMVLADAEKLRQVLANLLSNAVKFTERGGAISVDSESDRDTVTFAVRDTGIGIAGDQLERIFDPFVQVRSDLTRTAEGTGLGLAISRDLARGMGGDLTAESTLGVGSRFLLVLPRIVDS